MSISSSLSAGVAGLNANATRLATISDNIANSSTYGYKRAATEFESLVLSGTSGSASYSAGGVKASTQRLVDERGSLVGTSNALDLAVAGRGMLPVMQITRINEGSYNTQPMLMTSTGAFRVNADGILTTDSGLVLLGWPATSTGDIPTYPRDTMAGLQPIVIPASQIVGDPTTKMSLAVNLPSAEAVSTASGNAIPMSVEYFGNLGSSERLDISFTPTIPAAGISGTSNSWTMEIRDSASGNTVIGRYALMFDDSRGAGGALSSVTVLSGGGYDPVEGSLSLNVGGGPMTISIGRPGDSTGITQLSRSFTPNSTKDGSPVGNLTTVEVDNNGYLMATYDTGYIRRLAQIPLVDVPNFNALTALDNQTFQVSKDSGAFFLWNAGEGPTGAIKGYAREGSATDVATELTALITTQRAYSSNAKVITTVDEMLQETTNMKR